MKEPSEITELHMQLFRFFERFLRFDYNRISMDSLELRATVSFILLDLIGDVRPFIHRRVATPDDVDVRFAFGLSNFVFGPA